MKAVRLFEYGDPSVMRYVDVPTPPVGDHDVLIKVRATSVNRWDLLYRRGAVVAPPGRAPLPLPFQLGREAAGDVEAVGSDVTRFRPGDRVVTMTCPSCGRCEWCGQGLSNLCVNIGYPGHQRFGTQAEYVATPEAEVLSAPDGLSYEKLACALWSYSAVWRMAITRGRLQAGQDVLITGASSGMGTAAVQIARLAGARRIFGLTGSARKVAQLEALGVDYVLDYTQDDVAARVRESTGGRGVDLVLDPVGGDMFTLGIDCLRLAGTLVLVGTMGGRDVHFRIEDIFRKEVSVLGTRGATRGDQELALSLVGDGHLDPVVAEVLPLADAAEAHRKLEAHEVVGKIVLVP